MPETIDVEKLMHNVEEQLRQGTGLMPSPGTSPKTIPIPQLRGVATALQTLRFRKALVGAMPAAPATLRARCGAVLVGIVRRSLFWLNEQLDDFIPASRTL